MGMERLVADWEQLDLLVNLLARSGTGQHLSSYTSVITGPRRTGEADGPDEMHVVILDNGRSDILGTEFQEILSCIRCGACLNVCPVYRQIGGHTYGWVYSGPVGAVLTPLLAGAHHEAAELANASTLCGACMDVCPVSIPLQDLLLALRRRRAAGATRSERAAWKAWAAAWSQPALYRASVKAMSTGRGLTRFAAHTPGLARWAAGRGRASAGGAHLPRALARRDRVMDHVETGDRRVFLARLRRRLTTPAPENPAHPLPPLPAAVPEVHSRHLDPDDLVGSFERAATAASAEVHRVAGSTVPDDLLAALVMQHEVRSAVVSAEPEAAEVGRALEALGVTVEPLSIEAAARADLGVTSATYGFATTGSVVQESDVAGGRTASLLPPVHLCVLPADRLVPSTAALLRTLGAPGRLPSNLVVITGPSRSGDIEQIITLGVHGPTALHIALLEAGS